MNSIIHVTPAAIVEITLRSLIQNMIAIQPTTVVWTIEWVSDISI